MFGATVPRIFPNECNIVQIVNVLGIYSKLMFLRLMLFTPGPLLAQNVTNSGLVVLTRNMLLLHSILHVRGSSFFFCASSHGWSRGDE